MSISATRRCRWGDDDHYFGPLTLSIGSSFRHFAVMLSSGDEEGGPASFRVSMGSGTAILALPRWLLRPEKKKVTASSWDAETVRRLGRNWYWSETPRRYGISITDGHLNINFGRQTMDSSTEQSAGWFLPWTQWRFVRHSLYDLGGRHYATLPQGRWDSPARAESERLARACEEASFVFTDFDGEQLTAATKIEEREWLRGTGWFKWLSLFWKPKVIRSLDIQFSGETGHRKGSWKGGTIGHSIDMLPGELHLGAFERYCAAHGMQLVTGV